MFTFILICKFTWRTDVNGHDPSENLHFQEQQNFIFPPIILKVQRGKRGRLVMARCPADLLSSPLLFCASTIIWAEIKRASQKNGSRCLRLQKKMSSTFLLAHYCSSRQRWKKAIDGDGLLILEPTQKALNEKAFTATKTVYCKRFYVERCPKYIDIRFVFNQCT